MELALEKDPFVNLILSERLSRDVELLMNSTYWLNALKCKRASGISDSLIGKFYKKCELRFNIEWFWTNHKKNVF